MPTINGVAYDGGCIEMRFGASAFGIQEANHEEDMDVKKVRPLGSQAATTSTPGAYEAKDDTVKMETGEFKRLLDALPSNGYSGVRFPITMDYIHPDLGTMHVVKSGCRITGVKGGFKEGSDATMVELKIFCMQIEINGKTLNTRKGTGQNALQQLVKL